MGRPAANLKGLQFGDWTVIQRDGTIGAGAAWLCRCPEGHEKRIRAQRLKEGRTTRCPECRANKLDAIYARDREFIEVWQRSQYMPEVIAALGITIPQARAVAARLRLNKVKLKRMRSGRSPRAQQHYAAMRELAEKALRETEQ